MKVDFYKELHNRELLRTIALNDGVNMPIGIVTLLISLLSLIFKENKELLNDCLVLIFFSIVAILLFITCFFLIRSMNNFFMNYDIKNLSYADELLLYEDNVRNHNKLQSDKVDIKLEFKRKYAEITTHNKKINDRRADNLYYAKSSLIFAVSVSMILIIIYFLKIL